MTQDLNEHGPLFLCGIAEPRRPSVWTVVRRYIGALFIYVLYWVTIVGAFRNAVGSASRGKAQELVKEGIIESAREYGWGDHYVWYLIVFCLATLCSALLAGATAKKNGTILASVANAPILLLMGLYSYFYYAYRPDCQSPIAWGVVLPISIVGSVVISAVGGSKGEKWQCRLFGDSTVFGIRPIHWWWLIFPLSLLIQTLPAKVIYTILLLLGSVQIAKGKYAIPLFLLFAVFASFTYFMAWGWYRSFQLLSTRCWPQPRKSVVVFKVLFYLFGIPLLFDGLCVLLYASMVWFSIS